MALPLLLAGPILRRVEANLVTVWVALSQPAEIKLLVWEGLVAAGAPNPFVTSVDETAPVANGTDTLAVGERLHLGLITARIPETSAKSFQSDTLYSYDLQITSRGGTTQTLKSLGMLDSVPIDGVDHVPLGYARDQLPGFAPCPSTLEDLKIIYGSCRKIGHPDPDAMVWIDDLIAKDDTRRDARKRPHQLFLGGDQIYADDTETLQMLQLIELGRELIGTVTTSGLTNSREQVPVDHTRTLRSGVTDLDQADPFAAYEPEDPIPGAHRLPIDRDHFPAGWRFDLVQRGAQLTSIDGYSHLISIGEFAAAYLCAWSNACWANEIPGTTFRADASPNRRPLRWTDEVRPESEVTLPQLATAVRVAADLFAAQDDKRAERDKKLSQAELRRSHTTLKRFREGLARVQRALANVPTYMIFDDHDVTDDFFLNPLWRERVQQTALGRAILNNAMITYALFQDWGNQPLRYDAGLPKELLTRVSELFPATNTDPGPAGTPYARLTELFAHNQLNGERPDGRYGPVNPPIRWDFMIDGPKHRVLVLDNRTRRSFASRLGPPGNVSAEAMLDQIPVPPLPTGREILVVVAPLQVLGPPVLDDLIAPLVYRAFDLTASGSSSATSAGSRAGARGMTGTNPDAIEAWAADPVTFEELLGRLEPYGRVVLLSGDVHNSTATLLSYWKGAATRPARIAQFVSSGFKNVMPPYIAAVDRSAGFAQQMIRANLGTERIAWARPVDDMIIFPENRDEDDLVPTLRAKLSRTPVLLPTWGWPDDNDDDTPNLFEGRSTRLNPARPPEWRWRLVPLLDRRPDALRPEPIRPLALDHDQIDAQLADPDTLIDAYQAIAGRHQGALGHLRNARQILFGSNFGLCRFEPRTDGTLDAIHEVHTAFRDPDNPALTELEAQPYMVQRARLGPVPEDPPTRLRERVIDKLVRTGTIEQPVVPSGRQVQTQ